MKIKAITKYVYEGVEYNSLTEIKEELHEIIGLQVLDKIQRTCPLEKHKDYLTLLELLCQKDVREVLVRCLTVEYDKPDQYNDSYDYETINILDI